MEKMYCGSCQNAPIAFPRTFHGYTLTDEECLMLLQGGTLTIENLREKNRAYSAVVVLEPLLGQRYGENALYRLRQTELIPQDEAKRAPENDVLEALRTQLTNAPPPVEKKAGEAYLHASALPLWVPEFLRIFQMAYQAGMSYKGEETSDGPPLAVDVPPEPIEETAPIDDTVQDAMEIPDVVYDSSGRKLVVGMELPREQVFQGDYQLIPSAAYLDAYNAIQMPYDTDVMDGSYTYIAGNDEDLELKGDGTPLEVLPQPLQTAF